MCAEAATVGYGSHMRAPYPDGAVTMTKPEKPTGMRRNLANYGDPAFSVFLRKAFIKALGYTDDALERPIVGIVDTTSGYNACHANIPDLIEAVKRGMLLQGGIPVPFPIISIQESFANPTSMYLRNLMAIDAEEMIRGQPMDSVVLLGGCDKTVPAMLMGAISANVPAIMLVTGPMMAGSWRGERLGACTDCRRFWARFRAGEITEEQINEVNSELAPTDRHLRRDGHGEHDGARNGSDGHDAAGRRLHPGRHGRAPSPGRADRRACRRDGC